MLQALLPHHNTRMILNISMEGEDLKDAEHEDKNASMPCIINNNCSMGM